jgi:hypothetical protein
MGNKPANMRRGPQKAIYIDQNTGDVIEWNPVYGVDPDTGMRVVVNDPRTREPVDKTSDYVPRPMCRDGSMGDMQCKNYDQNAAWAHYRRTGRQPNPTDFMLCPGASCFGSMCECGTDCVKTTNSCCPKDYEIRNGMCIKPAYIPDPTTMPVTTMPATTQPSTTIPATQASSSCPMAGQTWTVPMTVNGETVYAEMSGDSLCKMTGM